MSPLDRVSATVSFPFNVAHDFCELRDVGQVSLLSRGPRIADLGNRESQQFVVCEKRERTPFQKVADVSNSQIRG